MLRSRLARSFVSAAIVSLFFLSGVGLAEETFLLLDSRLVGETTNAHLAVGTVTKHTANPLFAEDKPWEIRFDNLYANVIYDSEEKLFKCWYSPFIVDVKTKPPMEEWDRVRYRPGKREMGVCYAISQDGLKWEKPELGLVEFDGSTKNNLVLRGAHGAGIFKDLNDRDPSRRYKMFYKGSRMSVRFSPDGLHWGDEISCEGINARGDTHNNAFWVPERDAYVGITRLFDGQRLVGRTESRDFLTWTPAVEVLRGDKSNQTYAMPAFRYANVYLGLVMVLRRSDDRVHCELAWSPDTQTWHRIEPGTPLIPLAETRGAYDWGCAYAAASPVVMPDGRIRLYYGASNGRHTSWRDGFLALATLRTDGWAGYQPQDLTAPAIVCTVAKAWPVDALRITADAEGGSVTVSVLDPKGKTLARSRPVHGNVTGAAVTWEDPSALAGIGKAPVRLKFELARARLYSFSFQSGTDYPATILEEE